MNIFHSKPKGFIPLLLIIIIAAGLAVGGGIAIHSIKTKTNNWLILFLLLETNLRVLSSLLIIRNHPLIHQQ